MEVKVSAGFVTYNPNIELLGGAIESIRCQVETIYIVDNKSQNIDEIILLVSSLDNVILFRNDKNLGIAAALNQIADASEGGGFQWFLTLDQDSVCAPNMMDEYYKCLKDNSIGMICPTIHLRIHGRKSLSEPNKNNKYVETAITSGCLVRVAAWKSVNGFWDDLFIDKVDDDFCYSLREKGWRILQTGLVVLEHQIGNPKKHSFLLWSYYTDSYPAFRYYYIARNTVIIYKLHKNTGCHSSIILAKKFLKILMGENNRIPKLKELCRGIITGIKWALKKPYNRNKIQ